MGEAGKAGSGLASLNNFSGLWDLRAVPSGAIPGSGITVIGGWWPGM